MSRLKELRQRKVELTSEARAIVNSADPQVGFTDEQKERLTGLKASLAQVDELLVAEEAIQDFERSCETMADPNEAADRRAKAPAADASKFKSLGEQLQAVARATIDGDADKRLQFAAAPTGAGESVGTDGGYLVQQDYSAELFRRAYETGQFASRTRRIPISANSNGLKMNAIKESSRVDGSRWGAVQAYWTGEAEAMTASRPKFRQIELDLKKLTGLFYATDEILADASALETVVREAFGEEFGFKLDDAIVRGTGVGMPLGILSHASTVVSTEKTDPSTSALQAADTVIVPNITDMWSRMWARSRGNAVWFINQQVEPQLMVMKIGDTPIYIPAGGFSASPYATLLGRPVIAVEQANELGLEGDVMLLDLSQYLLIEKGGVESASSMHVRFLQNEMVFRFVMRVDGQPGWHTTLTPFKGSATLSPFVVLGERDGTS